LLSADLKDCIHDDTPDVSRLERSDWFMTNRSGLTL
jgi:hypothetical protein